MKLSKLAGATSEIWQLFIADSSSTVGAGKTGLAFNTAGLTAYYHRDTDTTATAITLVTMTVGTFTSSGFKEIDATNMPGWYQFCPPNAAIAAGAKSAGFHLKGVANMADLPIEVQLTAVNPDDAVRGGMTALPNAAAEAAGGLFTRGAGAGQINQANNGQIDANAARTGGTVNTGRDIGASVLLSPGTGTGQLSLSSGAVTVGTNNDKTGYGLTSAERQAIWDFATSLLTTAGSIGKRLADFITGDAYARLGAPAGASTAADIAAIFARLGAPAGASTAADIAAVLSKTPDSAQYTNARAAKLDNLSGDAYALLTSAQAEPTGVPAANATPMQKWAWHFACLRNRQTQTASQLKVFADDASTVIGTAALSDDGTTFDRGEIA